jgi:hypothetical protein
MWENTVKIHSILKEKNYKAKFLTSSILKSKIDKDNFEKTINKKGGKLEKKESNFWKNKRKKRKFGKNKDEKKKQKSKKKKRGMHHNTLGVGEQ